MFPNTVKPTLNSFLAKFTTTNGSEFCFKKLGAVRRKQFNSFWILPTSQLSLPAHPLEITEEGDVDQNVQEQMDDEEGRDVGEMTAEGKWNELNRNSCFFKYEG